MILSEIRTRLITESGRDDLVNGDGSDNGVDFYINAAIRFLDIYQNTPKTRATQRIDLAIDGIFIDLQYNRLVHDCWISNTTTSSDSNTGRFLLDERDLAWIKEAYPKIPITDIDSGKPLYWAILDNAGLGPEYFSAEDSDDLDATYDLEGILYGDHSHKTRIMIMPPPDVVFTLEIDGDWFSKILSADTDYNYWTKMYPELVIYTASMVMEGMMRNSAGVNDWLTMINMQTQNIEFDIVARESKNNNVMRG